MIYGYNPKSYRGILFEATDDGNRVQPSCYRDGTFAGGSFTNYCIRRLEFIDIFDCDYKNVPSQYALKRITRDFLRSLVTCV